MGTVAPYLGGPEHVEGRESLVGAVAPEFQMRDEKENYVSLRRLIRPRLLLLHLYRGEW
jgi:hypothetical protein